MSETTLTRDEVAAAVAACRTANRRPGLRPVWRHIAEHTGKRPSFSTVSRFLADLDSAPAATPTTAPPDQVVAQVQQLAPALWQAAIAAARAELASELHTQAQHLAAAGERERELLGELDEAQARRADAEAERHAAEQRATAMHERFDAQAAAMQALAEAQRQASERWAMRERDLSARQAQLERECATLAAEAHHAREERALAAGVRDRLAGELHEAQRRADADLALNAHLREQLTTRDEDAAMLRAQLAEATARERQALITAAAAERQARQGAPLLRELRMGLARLEHRVSRLGS